MSREQYTALITGGSRGIGRAIALELARDADALAILYAGNHLAAEETVCKIQALGKSALAICCDVSDPGAVKAAVSQVRSQLPPIKVLVNNAGITRDGLSLRMEPDDFEQVIKVNLNGAFYVSQACYRDLMKGGWGRIVNISSVSGLMGNPGQANYASAKAGMIGLTKTLARELAGRGVTVNALAPGFIDTEMTQAMKDGVLEAALAQVPAGRLGKAQEIAAAVGFLCSPQAAYITGAVLQVDGGMYL